MFISTYIAIVRTHAHIISELRYAYLYISYVYIHIVHIYIHHTSECMYGAAFVNFKPTCSSLKLKLLKLILTISIKSSYAMIHQQQILVMIKSGWGTIQHFCPGDDYKQRWQVGWIYRGIYSLYSVILFITYTCSVSRIWFLSTTEPHWEGTGRMWIVARISQMSLKTSSMMNLLMVLCGYMTNWHSHTQIWKWVFETDYPISL
jgi:hypothetical protein